MKVKDLIAALAAFPDDADVVAVDEGEGTVLSFDVRASEDPPDDGSTEVWVVIHDE